MKYSIIYAQPNILTDEKISLGLVCMTEKGWFYKYSKEKVDLSRKLLKEWLGDYVENVVTDFQRAYLDGKSNLSILKSLDTLNRYSNNYIVFSKVVALDLDESLMSPERLYSELIEQ